MITLTILETKFCAYYSDPLGNSSAYRTLNYLNKVLVHNSDPDYIWFIKVGHWIFGGGPCKIQSFLVGAQ